MAPPNSFGRLVLLYVWTGGAPSTEEAEVGWSRMVLGDRGGRREEEEAEMDGMTLPDVLVAAVPALPRLSDAAAAERVAS